MTIIDNTIYLEVNANGLVVNAISWDGESPYFPEEGITLYPFDPNINHWIGWTLNVDGSWSAPIEFNDIV